MLCPHCNELLNVDSVVYVNIESYGGTKIINTNCCNNPIYLRGSMSFTAEKYFGNKKEDDWGNKIKLPKGV